MADKAPDTITNTADNTPETPLNTADNVTDTRQNQENFLTLHALEGRGFFVHKASLLK